MITGPQARELGRKIVFEHPAGIGPTAIGQLILALHPDMKDDKGRPNGTIRGAVWDLDKRFPDIVKTGAGFAPKNGTSALDAAEAVPAKAPKKNARAKRAPSPIVPTREEAPEIDRVEIQKEDWIAAQQKIAALEDAVSQAHAEIQSRETQIVRLTNEIRDAKTQIASPVGVLAEAQNAAVLVDIRQAVLAGSEEGTLEAVQRVVADLGRVRTQLALTGIKDDGKRLKAARKVAGITQPVLGMKLGYTGRHTIDDIERGKYPLAKHPRVLKWVQKVEADHVGEGEPDSVHKARQENPARRSGARHPAGGRQAASA